MYDFSLFPTRLKNCITERGCTQVELATHLDISKHTLTKYLNGRIPETTILYALSRFFNKSMEWFLTGENETDGTIIPSKIAQKTEAISDPDLKDMMNILKALMESDDPDLRGWTKVQFKTAFKEYYHNQDEKRR